MMETSVYRQGTDLFIEVAIKNQTIYLETVCQEVRVMNGKLILLRRSCDPALYQKERRGEFYEPKYSLTALLEGAEEPLSPYLFSSLGALVSLFWGKATSAPGLIPKDTKPSLALFALNKYLSPSCQRKPEGKKEGIIGIELEEAISEKRWWAYRQQFRGATEQDIVCWVREIIEANYLYENIYDGDDNNMWELLDKDYEYWSDYFGKEIVQELCAENIRGGWMNPGDGPGLKSKKRNK